MSLCGRLDFCIRQIVSKILPSDFFFSPARGVRVTTAVAVATHTPRPVFRVPLRAVCPPIVLHVAALENEPKSRSAGGAHVSRARGPPDPPSAVRRSFRRRGHSQPVAPWRQRAHGCAITARARTPRGGRARHSVSLQHKRTSAGPARV